ncbi:MAG TPA: diacylglycerol kinase family protein [Acidobacteriota bacterium]|nr:diacylglycerol kinase family protein [Acidobacteriota bacterium]
MQHAEVIVNPIAGQGAPMRVAEEARAHLEERGWEVGVRPTSATGHATVLAQACVDSTDLIVVVGGDGTVREAVAGLDGAPVPVGFVPMGNANVLARELGIPQCPERSIPLLTTGQPLAIDVGRVDGMIFLSMVSVGYDGWTIAGVDRLRGTRLGGWMYRHGGSSGLYVLAGLPPLLLRARPNRVRIEADGKVLARRYPSAVFSNAEAYGLGWAMTPGADIRDGRLDHQANRRSAPWFVVWTIAASILHRRVPGMVAEYGDATSYRVSAERPFRWQADGDPMPPRRELEIELLRRHALIVTPSPA